MLTLPPPAPAVDSVSRVLVPSGSLERGSQFSGRCWARWCCWQARLSDVLLAVGVGDDVSGRVRVAEVQLVMSAQFRGVAVRRGRVVGQRVLRGVALVIDESVTTSPVL